MSVVTDLIRDMGLWKPQKEALEALDAVIRQVSFSKEMSKAASIGRLAAVEVIQQQIARDQFDFNAELTGTGGTEFPSLCNAIATGGGKSKLMGADIAYLYKTKGYKNYFILSKGETIYNKHRFDDFNPDSPKYVFTGLVDFPVPRLLDGDNFGNALNPELFTDDINLYIFNVEKIFPERGEIEFAFHKFNESLGGSFSDLLRGKSDLVLLMDESHNIRGDKSLKAVNALKPILGLEFTATPVVKNILYSYSLRQAIDDGLVKRPVVVARRDDDSLPLELEDIKIQDGLRRHERKKAAIRAYCKNYGLPVILPRVLISTQDINHCEQVANRIRSDQFLGGRYAGKVLDVHSGSEDVQIQRLLDLEKGEDDEIVVHVNKLKEGWDVKLIYTIIPLRASVSEILTTQTLGRGLRLPFGRQVSRDSSLSDAERKELGEIDTLEIISHERYSFVVAKAREILDVEVRADDDVVWETWELRPDPSNGYLLEIPGIQTRYQSGDNFVVPLAQVGLEHLEDLNVKLVGTDIASGEEKDFKEIMHTFDGNLVNYFVRELIRSTDEFDISDKATLQQFVQDYFGKVQVHGGEKDVVLYKNRGKILKDIQAQLRDKLDEDTTVEYVATDRRVEFRPTYRTVPVGQAERHKDAVLEEDIISHIIKGYQRTIFPQNVFDSRQEKWLADILDRDDTIERWVRPPNGQLVIAYEDRGYNPDFVAETIDGKFYVLEIKQRGQIHEETVQAKARAGVQWCKVMSSAMRVEWAYKLIPHDAIPHANMSFNHVISSAVSTTVK